MTATDPDHAPDDRPDADEQALRWFMAMREPATNAASTQRQTEFERWLAAHPHHPPAYRRCEREWAALSPLKSRYTGPAAAIATPAKTPAGIRHAPARAPRLRPLLMAACLLAAVSGLWLLVERTAAPVTLQLNLAGSVPQRHPLPDGSMLDADTGTRLSVRYTDTARVVTLERGGVMVDVAADARRPFSVRTPHGTATVLGTAFAVESWDQGSSVAVARGAVSVQSASAPQQHVRLTPGQGVLADANGLAPVRPVDARHLATWRQGTLVFRNTPLPEALAVMARHFPAGRTLELPTKLPPVPVSMRVQLDNVEAALEALPSIAPVTVATVPDGLRIQPR